MSSYTGQQTELYYSLPAAVTKNTFTAQAVISAAATANARCIIPANYFSMIGKSVHFEANGSIANTTAATFAFGVGLDSVAGTPGGTGGAVLFTTPTVTPTASTTCPWTIEMDMVAQAVGNSMSIQTSGEIDVFAAAQNSAWNSSRSTTMIDVLTTGLNGEVNLFLELLGTWSASSASNTTTVKQFKVYLEN